MNSERSSIFNIKTVLGVFIILAGLIALIDNLGFDLRIDFWDFWPMILIIVGLGKLLQPAEYRNTFAGVIVLAIGVLFQMGTLDIIDFGFSQLWPFVLILLGIMIIRQAFFPGRKPDTIESNVINLTAIMDGGEYAFTSQNLVGGTTTAIMGGGTINLSNAEMQGESMVIDNFVLMGGVDIIIPKHWNVVFKGLPIMGGMSDNTIRNIKTSQAETPETAPNKMLIIKGMAIMGGVEVKN